MPVVQASHATSDEHAEGQGGPVALRGLRDPQSGVRAARCEVKYARIGGMALTDAQVKTIRKALDEIEDIVTDDKVPTSTATAIFKALDRIDEIVGKG